MEDCRSLPDSRARCDRCGKIVPQYGIVADMFCTECEDLVAKKLGLKRR